MLNYHSFYLKAALCALAACGWVNNSFPRSYIVRDGRPNAQIVIAENPPRTTRLAALELKFYIEKISGAALPIVTAPTGDCPVKIYVGASPWTEKLGIEPYDTKDGGYRIVSGKDWLALLGDDTEFTPIEPWPHSNSDWKSRVQAEWEKITGASWGNPMAGLYKNYNRHWGVWAFDERGSFNAVCDFLRSLGVRWYLPGELGEVLPEMKSIPLPKIDETVLPDFQVRRINFRFAIGSRDNALWAMHLGLCDQPNIQIPHGMIAMTDRKEIMEAHPDWFALYKGKRHNNPEDGNNQLCYSNPELFKETVRYVRALLDHYDLQAVSVMPPDGYGTICQCPLCKGKDAPERGRRGALSDYIWDFVNRVAKEVGKTHPGKWVSNCAYGIYTLPPEKIEKLEPNVLVCIVGGRRPMSNKPEQQEAARQLRESWVTKTDNPIMIFENYPLTSRGMYLPAFTPHSLGESINATKGMSMGEDIWLSMGHNFDTDAIGFNHFTVYFTARMYWGGKDQDVDEMFDEYCRLFYGPAGKQMKAFFEYSEANWQEMEKDKEKVDKALDLFDAAQKKTDPASVYGKRIALVNDYLKNLRNKSKQLGKKRGRVPLLRILDDVGKIVIDGRSDDDYWLHGRGGIGGLREIQTGHRATFGTSFKVGWSQAGSLYLAIRCNERPGEALNIATNQDIWQGDAVVVLVETDSHAYYEIAVNPTGAVYDADWSTGGSPKSDWDSQIEIATQVSNDHWTVEMRIPVTTDENDPLHKVIGRKPSKSLPWHVNIIRQRVRTNGTETTAFSPTGSDTWHVPAKFGQLFMGRSHTFEADESPDDFLDALRAASTLKRQRKYAEAIDAFTSLAGRNITDLQKSYVLEMAADCARRLRKPDLAGELAARIPIPAVAKTVRMQNLLAARKAQDLIAEFESEDISAWPFWKQGDGYLARGRAWSATKQGKKAEADLTRALEPDKDHMARATILLAIAGNRQYNLDDKAGALKAYMQVVDMSRIKGSANYFRAVQRAAHLLSQAGKHTEAEAVLDKVKTSPRGYWRASMLLARANALEAAGKTNAAFAVCRALLEDTNTPPAQIRQAKAFIAARTNAPPAVAK